MTPIRLYVNVDHVATVREARKTDEPDPADAALLAEAGGADGITAHLREDRRHVQDRDLERLASTPHRILNIELARSPEVLERVIAIKPFQATLVPERREEITTEGGLDLSHGDAGIKTAIGRLRDAGVRVSLFVDPELDTLAAAQDLGVTAVELHTGRYSNHWRTDGSALTELARAAEYAKRIGLAVHAGHGLTYLNTAPVAAIPEIEELNIGHSIVSRAIMTGMREAVAVMRSIIDRSRG